MAFCLVQICDFFSVQPKKVTTDGHSVPPLLTCRCDAIQVLNGYLKRSMCHQLGKGCALHVVVSCHVVCRLIGGGNTDAIILIPGCTLRVL